jgi:hypothetical protein
MAEFRVRFSGRAHAYTEEEIAVAVEAMRHADPLTQGPHLPVFEAKFREYAGVPHAFAVHTATSALELAAQLCCFRPGDEAVIPSHTFTSTAYPFVKNGARIVWADIERDTRVVSARTLAAKITSNTRALVVPHLQGEIRIDFPYELPVSRRLGLRTRVSIKRSQPGRAIAVLWQPGLDRRHRPRIDLLGGELDPLGPLRGTIDRTGMPPIPPQALRAQIEVDWIVIDETTICAAWESLVDDLDRLRPAIDLVAALAAWVSPPTATDGPYR